MWNPSVVSWLDETGCVKVKHIGQYICFGAMCDIMANSDYTDYKNTDYMDIQPWELGKKYDSNFIFPFAVLKVRYGGITTAKIFKHGNYLK